MAIALWGYGSYATSNPWILSSNQFTGDRYQNSPYVANGDFGQRLPADDVGHWVYRDNVTGGYQLNCHLAAGPTKSHIREQGKTSLDNLRRALKTRRNGREYPWVFTNNHIISQLWDWNLKRGDTLAIYKFVGIGSSAAFPANPLLVAKDAAILARSIAWDTLISEHTEKWDADWDDVDIVIPGDQDLQSRTLASLFHILTNLLPEDIGFANNSISVGGLSSDSYAGLVWYFGMQTPGYTLLFFLSTHNTPRASTSIEEGF
ncbi:hypothetical protein J3E68DRAFT_428068 [Trichoderma sp. SZMC 28012]